MGAEEDGVGLEMGMKEEGKGMYQNSSKLMEPLRSVSNILRSQSILLALLCFTRQSS